MKLGWASLARFGQPSKTLDSIKLDKAAYLQFVSPLLQLLPRKSSQLYLKKKIRGRHGIGEASTSWRWVWAVASSQKRITGRGKGQDAVEHKPLYRTSPATAGQPRWSTRRSGPHLVAFACRLQLMLIPSISWGRTGGPATRSRHTVHVSWSSLGVFPQILCQTVSVLLCTNHGGKAGWIASCHVILL